MKLSLIVALIVLALTSVASCQVSDDYKDGFKDAAQLFKTCGEFRGFLDSTYMILETFDKLEDEGGDAGVFAAAFIDNMAPIYNNAVEEYNAIASIQNMVSETVLGDEFTDDIRFQKAEVFE